MPYTPSSMNRCPFITGHRDVPLSPVARAVLRSVILGGNCVAEMPEDPRAVVFTLNGARIEFVTMAPKTGV